MATVARRLVSENRSVIVEGVHLAPGALAESLADHPSRPVVVERLVTALPSSHRANLERRRIDEPLRRGERHVGSFDRIELIQHHLREQAQERGVPMMDIAAATAMTQDLVGEIVERLRTVAA